MSLIDKLQVNIKHLKDILDDYECKKTTGTDNAQIESLEYSLSLLIEKLNICNDIRNNILQIIDLGKKDSFSSYVDSNSLYLMCNNKHKCIEIGNLEIGNLEDGSDGNDYLNHEYYPIDKIDLAIEAFLERYFNHNKEVLSSTGSMYKIRDGEAVVNEGDK